MAPSVSGIFIHPVKSCRARPVDRAVLDEYGLVGDRRFLVVDERGRFRTQRETPRLALLEAEVIGDRLSLSAPGMEPLSIPRSRSGAGDVEVVVWRDTVLARDLGGDAANWLTLFLESPARLVAMAPGFQRAVRKPAAVTGDAVAFADACPLLVIGEASLADLNARLASPLSMDRFRPGLVVRGAAPYAEDGWRRIRIGNVILRAAGPCARCVVTTTDQRTLARTAEPLRTLASCRRGPAGEVWFGQNFIHETKTGTLEVGMAIEVLE
jgi:uncharacterized protein